MNRQPRDYLLTKPKIFGIISRMNPIRKTIRKIYFAHPSSINYAELYEAILNSAELRPYEFFLPHKEDGGGADSSDIIRSSDLFIAEVSAPSTGLGIEMGRAEAGGIPILVLSKAGARVSTCFDFIHPTPEKRVYADPLDMAAKISEYLSGSALSGL